MDDRLILVKCITLLYRESLIPDKTDTSADLVRTILAEIKLPEYSLAINHERDVLSSLRDTALYMCSGEITQEKEELLQRLKVNCASDTKLYEALEQGIMKDMDEGSLKRTVIGIQKFIRDVFRENEIVKIVKNASTDLAFNRDKIKNMREFVSTLVTKLEPFQVEASRKDPAIISSADVGDTASLCTVFDEVKAMADTTGLLVTGWQGLNEMIQGGFRRGEEVVCPALQHKYKTGFSLTLFKQLAIYNKPMMINPNKKPCLVRISFEDALATNLQFLYQNIYFNETGKLPEIAKLSTNHLAGYVQEKMGINGYHLKMLRVNATEWTYRDMHNYILELESNGFEIHACIIDYLPLLPTTGCEDGPSGHALRDLYRRVRGFFSARKITVITPHQLSTDAKQLVRDGRQDFVKTLPGNGYYAGSKQIDQEVDLEIYLHIEKLNGRSYLTIQRGKHRGVDVISDTQMYMVLPFPVKGPIPDDLGKAPIHSRKVGGGPVGSGEEVPFFAFDN